MWWGEKKDPIYYDFSLLGVDIHSHLIPRIDDGSQSMDESLEILSQFVDMGYRKVITTPHVIADKYPNTPEIINDGLLKLREAAEEHKIPIEIEAAAEYYIDFAFYNKVKEKEKFLTFGQNYILVEISFINAPEKFFDILFGLQTEQYRPVLAHPERYSYLFGDLKMLEKLYANGILFQLNLGSLAGMYGGNAQRNFRKLVDLDMYNFVGTDCHQSASLDVIQNVLSNRYFEKIMGSGKLLNADL